MTGLPVLIHGCCLSKVGLESLLGNSCQRDPLGNAFKYQTSLVSGVPVKSNHEIQINKMRPIDSQKGRGRQGGLIFTKRVTDHQGG